MQILRAIRETQDERVRGCAPGEHERTRLGRAPRGARGGNAGRALRGGGQERVYLYWRRPCACVKTRNPDSVIVDERIFETRRDGDERIARGGAECSAHCKFA